MNGAFKTLKSTDTQVVPIITNKLWNITTSSYLGIDNDTKDIDIQFFYGRNITTESIFSNISQDVADSTFRIYPYLGYRTIRQLYYSNYVSSSYINYSSSADNFDQNTLAYLTTQYNNNSYLNYFNSVLKTIPTSSTSIIRIMSVSKTIYGSKILPKTLIISSSNYNIKDDGEGNLLDWSSNLTPIGNIIYPHGMIIITHPNYQTIFPTSSTDLGISGSKPVFNNIYFRGEHIIYENETRCTVEEDEFNFTLNPSSINSTGSLQNNLTSSIFNPYVTSIGLYNPQGELLAISKLAKPIQIPQNNSITFVVKWDS